MKNVLYISNIEVPYRVRFFNEFSKHCNLTVIYTRKKSTSRNSEWASSVEGRYQSFFLNGIKIGTEDSFSFKIIKYIFSKKYDCVILGCCNSLVQMFAILLMRLFKKPYILNIEGEMFFEGNSLKAKMKRFFIKGAKKYVTAGEKSAESLRTVVGKKPIIPYYFSSMSDEELKNNASRQAQRGTDVLIVGQYLYVKGLDVVLEAAKLDNSISYKIVGMGSRTQQFIEDCDADKLENVELIPFLQKKELEEEYLKCALFVLPSRQECWGLVINEAASFGIPIVSTIGSGAAVEFLANEYPQYLATVGDSRDLYEKIKLALNDENKEEYSEFLKIKGLKYSIERSVEAHCRACDICD